HRVDYRIAVMTRFLVLLLLCACAFCAGANSAMAAASPTTPVKIVAPFAPGGSADTLGRIVAQKLSESLKENFLVENRPGAGGVIGSVHVAKAQTARHPVCRQ